MKKKGFYIALIAFYAIFFLPPTWGWDNEVTHKSLTGFAAGKSLLNPSDGDFLRKIGLEDDFTEILIWKGHHCDDKTYTTECSVRDWLRYGAEKEDTEINAISGRFNNHFHDPLSGQGIDDYEFGIYHVTGQSTLEWAQDTQEQSRLPEGDQSWATLRTQYYIALTETSDASRKSIFAQIFKGLGHQMHLVQDMAVPYHVRNDAHAADSMQGDDYKKHLVRSQPLYFENWAKSNSERINRMASKGAVFPTLSYDRYYTGALPSGVAQSPVSQLWDANIYDGANPSAAVSQGLAEYTNANFFSEDTIFRPEEDLYHFFPYPKQSSTDMQAYVDRNLLPRIIFSEDDQVDYRVYLSKVADGDTGFTALAAGYFSKYFVDEGTWSVDKAFWRTFFLDEQCHDAYAEKLVPRAVGYSAALLDYFFRGRLDIRKFHVILEPGARIGGVEFEVSNDTHPMPGQAPDTLGEGSLDLVYRYRLEGQSEPIIGYVPRIHYITDAADPINSEYVPLKVHFPEALPSGAQDFSFTLVFLGKLGAEAGSVAVGAISSSTSRIAYSIQQGGRPNQSDIFVSFPDGSDIRAVTDEAGPNPWFFAPAWSPDGKKLAFEKQTCTDGNPDGWCYGDSYYQDIVIVDLMADTWYPGNVLSTFRYQDTENFIKPYPVSGPSFSPDSRKIVAVAGHAMAQYWALIVIDAATGQWRYINDWEFWQRKDLSGSAPDWNPEDNTIVYYVHRQPDPATGEMYLARDIYRIDADGGDNRALTRDGYWNTQPAWSPDGQWIVFVSDRDAKGLLDIWLMDRSGENMKKVRDCDADCFSPSFAPDGRRIAFLEGSDVYAMDLNGGNLTRITFSGFSTASPQWSPDLAPPSAMISADPMQIVAGESATLKWNSKLAFEGQLEPAIGLVAPQGSATVAPMEPTTYTLTVTGWGGTASDSVTINVHQP